MVAYVSPVVFQQPRLPLNPGDYIKSPSGVYYATLLSNNAELVVSQGTDPATSGLNVVWNTPAQSTAAGPPGITFDRGSGEIISVGEPVPGYGYYDLGSEVPGSNRSTIISLADNGTFTLSLGPNPAHPGQQTFSNNVNDPVVGYDLADISYDLANPTITSSGQVIGGVFKQTNNTSQTQVFPASLGLKYTKTSNWSFSVSEAITLGLKSSFDVGMPGIGATKQEISVSETTTIKAGKGGSDSEEKDFLSGVNVTVPPFSTYQAVLAGTRETFDIPFTYMGVAQYQDGAMVPVDGSGMFTGTDTGIFETVVSCVTAPGGCNTPPLVESALPSFGGALRHISAISSRR
ncbi:MAG: hypothetical protein ACREE9_03520 [Stellaceae bacterium]